MSGRKRSATKLAIVAMLIAAGAVVALGIIHVRTRHQVIQLGYKLTKANAKLRALQEENRRLRVEKSVLTSPDRIQRLARDRGMAPPATGQVKVISIPPELASASRTDGSQDQR